uniref:Uncharacterized protein n=1 Tax=Neolamprologus brichardi TaxID=32507 RepID=A0A3Q4GEZ1_NEOBR
MLFSDLVKLLFSAADLLGGGATKLTVSTSLCSGSEEEAEQAKQALLKEVGKVTDIVSSLGFSWWQGGPPHTQSLKDLHWVIETLLFSTFVSWKAFYPLVRDDSNCTYTFITGGAGEKLLMPGTGFLTVGAASTLAFCHVLREEYPEVPCKLNQKSACSSIHTPASTIIYVCNSLCFLVFTRTALNFFGVCSLRGNL